jgi:adenylate cyclase
MTSPPSERATSAPVSGRPTVLVVDDEPANLAIVAQLLGSEFRVIVARSGERALDLASASAPDLVLLDVEMPGLSGYATCERLKRTPGCEEVPVLFLTARSDAEDEARGFSVGAVDYIHKPFSPPVLFARVRTQLSLRRALEEARAQKRRADALLEVVLPSAVAEELVLHGRVTPRRLDRAVVLFADVVGFTSWCGPRAPEQVVETLHRLFMDFERIAREHEVDKLKTLGDGFMGGVGLLTPHPDPMMAAVRCCLAFAQAVVRHEPEWRIRAGAHIGPVVAGIVGGERYQFDVWGDTVNLAARLAGAGAPGRVCIAQSSLADIASRVVVADTGLRALKGKGDVQVVEISGLR